jgi:threonine aldolase
VIELEYIEKLREICDKYGVKLHLDGARVLNSCVFLKVEVKDYVKYFDTISVCLNKGLGCPVGSILMSTKEGIEKGKTIRKMLGACMK